MAPTWRERLWVAPAETRMGVRDVAEALGRPVSFVYRGTSTKTIPHRKLDDELTFTAGELRAWLQVHEESITRGPTAPARRLTLTGGRRA